MLEQRLKVVKARLPEPFKTLIIHFFNQEPGTANHVELDLAFTCTMYTSPDINDAAQLLLNKYRVLYNYLDFKADVAKYDKKTGLYLDPNEFAASNIKDWTMN